MFGPSTSTLLAEYLAELGAQEERIAGILPSQDAAGWREQLLGIQAYGVWLAARSVPLSGRQLKLAARVRDALAAEGAPGSASVAALAESAFGDDWHRMCQTTGATATPGFEELDPPVQRALVASLKVFFSVTCIVLAKQTASSEMLGWAMQDADRIAAEELGSGEM